MYHQAICWDRRRPARNERAARTESYRHDSLFCLGRAMVFDLTRLAQESEPPTRYRVGVLTSLHGKAAILTLHVKMRAVHIKLTRD